MGKKYNIYYKKNRKWHKTICVITHDKILFTKLNINDVFYEMDIINIDSFDIIEPGDMRITKQTDNCIRIKLKSNNELFICTDDKEYMTNIYTDIKLRYECHELLVNYYGR